MQSVLCCFAVGVVLLSLTPPTASFSHGASPTSCQEMIPGHIRAQPQDPRRSHVTLRTSASSYLPGQLVTVTVRSSRDFMGFLLQARSVDSGGRARAGPGAGVRVRAGPGLKSTRVGMGLVGGSWPLMPPGTHTLRCLSEGDTLTHSDKQLKRNLSFVWRAPDAPKGDIRFYITVVQSYFVYWAGIESAVVHDGTRGLWHGISSTGVERTDFASQENVSAPSALQQRDNKSSPAASVGHPTQSYISVETVTHRSSTSASLISPKTSGTLQNAPLSGLNQEAGTDTTSSVGHTENPMTSFSLSNHYLLTVSSPSAETRDKEVTTDSLPNIIKLNLTTASSFLPSTVSRPHQKDGEMEREQTKATTFNSPKTNHSFDQTNLPRPLTDSPGELIQDRTSSVRFQTRYSPSQPRRSSPAASLMTFIKSLLHPQMSSSPKPFLRVETSPSEPPLQSHSTTDQTFLSSETSDLPFQTDLSESRPANGPSGLKTGLKQTTPPHPYHKTAPSSLLQPIAPQTQTAQSQTDAPPEASAVSSQTQPPPSSPTSERRQTTSSVTPRLLNLAPTFTPGDGNDSKNVHSQIKSQTTNPRPAFFPSHPPPPPSSSFSGPTLHPTPSPSSIIQTPPKSPTLVSIRPSFRSTLFAHFSSSLVENQPQTVPALSALPSPSPISTPAVKPSPTYPETSSNSSIYPPSILTPSSTISFSTIPPSLSFLSSSVTLPSSSSPSLPLFGSSSSFSVSPPDQRPSPAASLPAIYNSPGPSSSPVPSQKVILIQTHMAPSDPEPNVTPTPKRAVVQTYPNPEPHPNLGHGLKPNVPNSDSKPKRPPPNPPGTPDKEGKYPEVTPRHSAWELGMLLGFSAGLGMLLVVGVRYVYRQACGKQTEVTLNARERDYGRGERGLIHVQECGDLVRVRKIRENSFVLLAEYDILTSPGD